jgi:murein DD-endopeptidase MepM/ murein hydrolase activator NlpD
MSGNYGSWWGQNYHIYCDYTDRLNQYFANDFPAHRNANVYSLILGKVEWAGWDYYDSEGYYTLGNYVVVRNGGYRALMAHLTSIASGISWGASVGVNTVIGYAGRTGGPWDEHVHARVAYGESLTNNGEPYGGHAVKPKWIRCFSCRATDPGAADGYADGQYDVKYSDGTKYYTRFYHGRWMRN